MARTELRSHPKFKRLVHRLKLPAPYVMGLLEYMWQAGYQSGNDLLGDETDVELTAEWPGKAGVLFAALKDLRFIDERNGRFHIHDLFDHAPEYVKKKMKRRGEKTEPLENKDLDKETADNGRHLSAVPNPTQPNREREDGRATADAEPEPERDDPLRQTKREAVSAFESWSRQSLGSGLNEIANDHRKVFEFVDECARESPIVRNNPPGSPIPVETIPRHLLIAQAVDALKNDRQEYKSNGIKLAITCVRNRLADWAARGIGVGGRSPPAQPSVKNRPTVTTHGS